MYDLIDPKLLEYLNKFYISTLYYVYPGMTDSERESLGYVPDKVDYTKYEYMGDLAIKTIKESTQEIMKTEYPDLKLERFQDFGMPSLRSKGSSMKPHVDGPPEYNDLHHGIGNLGSNFYLNDNYSGGELTYPKLDFEYKPVPNSLVIHRGTELFEHGVNMVTDGWRLAFGMFAFEQYDLPPLIHGINSDR